VRYVYLLESQSGTHRYVGVTEDLKRRLAEHNAGKLPHTAPHKPWHITTYTAFTAAARALAFVRYLKSGSGHAFARKHLW